jgi:hypothetical protein
MKNRLDELEFIEKTNMTQELTLPTFYARFPHTTLGPARLLDIKSHPTKRRTAIASLKRMIEKKALHTVSKDIKRKTKTEPVSPKSSKTEQELLTEILNELKLLNSYAARPKQIRPE